MLTNQFASRVSEQPDATATPCAVQLDTRSFCAVLTRVVRTHAPPGCPVHVQAGRLAITAAASHLICTYGGRDVATGDMRAKLLSLRHALEHELEALE